MDRKHRGVTVRGQSIQITFMLNGERCREQIRCGRKPTATDLRKASELRSSIIREIDLGTFDYRRSFPNSKKAGKFSSEPERILIADALDGWLRNHQNKCEYSTLRGYISAIKTYLIPEFGHKGLHDLSREDVEAWRRNVSISHKTINNVLIPLRMVFKEAFEEGVIENNVLSRIRNLKQVPREPRPFSEIEVQSILKQLEGECRNIIAFGFETGLRTSELIALEWADVSWKEKTASISKARVHGRLKGPKTSSGYRKVKLSDSAIETLRLQRSLNQESGVIFRDPLHEVA